MSPKRNQKFEIVLFLLAPSSCVEGSLFFFTLFFSLFFHRFSQCPKFPPPFFLGGAKTVLRPRLNYSGKRSGQIFSTRAFEFLARSVFLVGRGRVCTGHREKNQEEELDRS